MKNRKTTVTKEQPTLEQRADKVAKISFWSYCVILIIKFLLYISGLGNKTDMVILSRLLIWAGLAALVSIMIRTIAPRVRSKKQNQLPDQ